MAKRRILVLKHIVWFVNAGAASSSFTFADGSLATLHAGDESLAAPSLQALEETSYEDPPSIFIAELVDQILDKVVQTAVPPRYGYFSFVLYVFVSLRLCVFASLRLCVSVS